MRTRLILIAIIVAAVTVAGCATDNGATNGDDGPMSEAVTSPTPGTVDEPSPSTPDDDAGDPTEQHDADEQESAADGSATDAGEVVAAPEDADVVVEIEQFRFHPDEITVEVGDTIAWPNRDRTTHTVTFDDGGPDSGSYGHEESYRLTFDEPGTFTYFCDIHPYMTGTITVEG